MPSGIIPGARKCGDSGQLTVYGQPCRRYAVGATNKCQLHGGMSLTAKVKAEQMLAQSRLPACEALFDIIEQHQSDVCKTCGFPKGDAEEKRVVLQACRTVLDRTGLGPSSTIAVVNQSDGAVSLAIMTSDEKRELAGIIARANEIKAAVRARQETTGYGRPTINSPSVGGTQ